MYKFEFFENCKGFTPKHINFIHNCCIFITPSVLGIPNHVCKQRPQLNNSRLNTLEYFPLDCLLFMLSNDGKMQELKKN